MYVLSAVIESSVIYAFLRKKIKHPLPLSLGLSFFVNIYSYFLLFMIYYL
jgi:hypothetical protein